tara:strand:- start:98 stop:1705 length:1608 start_codon:yes stop_codon:yes gene_type:complete
MGTKTITPRTNNDGQIGSSSKYWDKGFFNTLHVNDLHTASSSTLSANGISVTANAGILFEGSDADEFETVVTATNPTADRAILLPDASGVVSLSDTTYSAGTLLDLSTTTFNVDLTEAAAATIAAGDNIIFLDGGASGTHAKGSINDVATLFAGTAASTGLSASSGVLSVTDLHPVGVDGSSGDILADGGDGTIVNHGTISIDGTATSGQMIDISASAITTGNAIRIVDDTYERASGHFLMDVTDTQTATIDRGGFGMLRVNYNRPGGSPVAAGQSLTSIGTEIRMDDNATNIGHSTLTGLDIHCDFANTGVGTNTATGIVTRVGGGDVNQDIKMINDADDSEYVTIRTGVGGVCSVATFSDDATGHITLSADGNITLTSGTDHHNYTSIKRRKMTVTSSSSHHDHDGDIVYFGAADGSVSQGDICYLGKDGSNNATWFRAQANAESTSTSLLAICLGTDPATDGMLLRGMVTLDHNTSDNNFGDPVYLSDTSAGDADMTAPADNNEVVRVIGYKMGNDDEIWFCPDNTWVVVSA